MEVPFVETWIAASLMVMGFILVWMGKVSAPIAIALTAWFAFFHGAAHGMEATDYSATGFAVGFVLSTLSLHVLGLGIGSLLQNKVRIYRLTGALVAGAGVYFLMA